MRRGFAKTWLERWKRSDLPILRDAYFKLKSDQAALFLEFALVFPILLMFTVFLIDVCLFWDGTTLANHTAFALARIAKVNNPIPTARLTSSADGGAEIIPVVAGTRPFALNEGVSAAAVLMATVTRGATNTDPSSQRSAELLRNIKDAVALSTTKETGWLPDKQWGEEVDWGQWVVKETPEVIVKAAVSENPITEAIEDTTVRLLQQTMREVGKYVVKQAVNKGTNFLVGEVAETFVRQLPSDSSWQGYWPRYAKATEELKRPGNLRVARKKLFIKPGGTVTLEHPSTGVGSGYDKPQIVTVTIRYPMPLMWFPFSSILTDGKSSGEADFTIDARGRCTMLVEPTKDLVNETAW